LHKGFVSTALISTAWLPELTPKRTAIFRKKTRTRRGFQRLAVTNGKCRNIPGHSGPENHQKANAEQARISRPSVHKKYPMANSQKCHTEGEGRQRHQH